MKNDFGLATRFQSGIEAAENGRKGGIASGEARRAKRSLRERVELIGSLRVSPEEMAELESLGIPGECDKLTLVAAALIGKAMQGDVAAFTAIRDILGEKPAERAQFCAYPQKVEIGFVETGVPIRSEE